jgi:hypothetical protein
MVNRARRFDRGSLQPAERMPGGRLVVDAYLTKSGVFEYVDATRESGIRREFRPPDEVFSKDSLATLALAPVTLDHPAGMVTPETSRGLVRGAAGENISVDDNLVRAKMSIIDDEAIRAVESGEYRETSCGYSCDIDETPGEHEGEEYDVVQRNIRYDHVALVQRGRMKVPDSIRLDGESVQRVEAKQPAHRVDGDKEMSKMKIKLKSTRRDVMIEDEVAEAVMAELEMCAEALARVTAELENSKAAMADMEKEKDEAEKAKDEAEAEKDDMGEKLDAALKRADADAFRAAVVSRVALVRKAEAILGASYKADGKGVDELEERTLKEACIKSKNSKLDLSAKSDAYVDARFDALCEDLESGFNPAYAKSIANKNERDDARKDAVDEVDASKAYEAMRANIAKQSNSPLTTRA